MKRKLIDSAAVLLILVMVLYQDKVYSMENDTMPAEGNEIISVSLPIAEERDLFSFFIDPLHILYNTFGHSGGDITVEKDKCLLFYNRDGGGYTFSSRSDSLDIINKSTVPIKVMVTAKLEKVDGISVVQDKEFGDRDSCELYLALVDSKGNEQPLSEYGEASLSVILDGIPASAYAYVASEVSGEYRYVCQLEDTDFDVYSFGLKGICNERGNWGSISGKPYVSVSWDIEPMDSGEESDKTSGSVSGNSISGGDMSATDQSMIGQTEDKMKNE